MDLVRGFVLKTSAGRKDEETFERHAAEPYGQILLTAGSAEMAEQVVSDATVAECVLRCGSSWRGCGIPADNLCLLAMQGLSQSAGSGWGGPLRSRHGPRQTHRSRGERRGHAQSQPTE
jgi:hypothetical protein